MLPLVASGFDHFVRTPIIFTHVVGQIDRQQERLYRTFVNRAVLRLVIAVALASPMTGASGSALEQARQNTLHSVLSKPSNGKRVDASPATPETLTTVSPDLAQPTACFGYDDDRSGGDRHTTAPFAMPVDGASVSSPFGLRFHPGTGKLLEHTGVDLAAPAGTPVNAAASGTVEFAGFDRHGYGRYVILQHGAGYSTWYAHLSAFAAHLRTGMHLRLGQRLGAVGRTGDATGPHLHFEVRYNHEPTDPLPLLGSRSEPALATGDLAAFQRHIAAVSPSFETERPQSPLATAPAKARDSGQGHAC
jgi:murein DD-endopeptidase MepM/ murein hydrolase activator NlpD